MCKSRHAIGTHAKKKRVVQFVRRSVEVVDIVIQKPRRALRCVLDELFHPVSNAALQVHVLGVRGDRGDVSDMNLGDQFPFACWGVPICFYLIFFMYLYNIYIYVYI